MIREATALEERLASGAEQLGVPVDAAGRATLVAYLRLLTKWNRVYNLTAIREPERMLTHHVLDSLAIVPYLHGDTLLDVGSGAGLPGLVAGVVRPEVRCTLLDSRLKKTRFLQQAVLELKLRNLRVIQARVEDLPGEERYATVTARAVGPLPEVWSLVRGRVAPGGRLLAMLGHVADEQVQAVAAAGATAVVHELRVPGIDGARHLVVVGE